MLVAGDMDFGIFAKMLPRIRPLARSITLYTNDEDKPLILSEQLHGYARMGQSGNDTSALKGVEVIDVSDLPDAEASGHLYHIYGAEVGRDIGTLLSQGTRAAERSGLKAAGGNLWMLQASQ